VAALLAELHARHRAVANRGAGPRSWVLGTEEAAETPLRHARLDTLGARVRLAGEKRIVEVFYAHAASATVLVLRREWPTDDPAGVDLARRRVAGTTLGALAGGNLITESAVRSASRAIRLGTGRVAKTTVSPSFGAWEQLPATLVAHDFTALAAELDALSPRPIRPRVEAELVRAMRVAAVQDVSYSPSQQRLDALVADEHGTVARITATHSAAAPAASTRSPTCSTASSGSSPGLSTREAVALWSTHSPSPGTVRSSSPTWHRPPARKPRSGRVPPRPTRSPTRWPRP
jgi:hypothetical protein